MHLLYLYMYLKKIRYMLKRAYRVSQVACAKLEGSSEQKKMITRNVTLKILRRPLASQFSINDC